jgi:cyanophycin synthetase
MNIVEIKVLKKGPNLWSIKRKNLIVMKLDIGEWEERPTNTIPGFSEKLKKLIPSLYEHRCSEGHAGGFFYRLDTGTWLGHVIEHIALEIQTLADMDCGFGRTRSTRDKGIYNVVFSYIDAEAGIYAGHAAVRMTEALIQDVPCDLEKDIQEMRSIYARNKLGPSTSAIVKEAVKLNIPYFRLNESSYVQLGYGAAQKKILATVTSGTSNIAVEIAGDKAETKAILKNAGIPVPLGLTLDTEEVIQSAIDQVKFPVVIKPLDSNHGNGATTNIKSLEDAVIAFRLAKEYSERVIIEQYIEGHDYRLLVISNRLVAAAKRIPAKVTGNGSSTIRELMEKVNSDPRRGDGHDNILTRIIIDDQVLHLLKEKALSLEAVLPDGKEVYLKHTANLSTGGTSEDVTDIVHPMNIFMAERISGIIGLDICGVDVISPDISKPLAEVGAIIEVNAGPGFRMHTAPSEGKSRPVGKAVIEMLFPDPEKSRIPIIAITGTNGKTTTTRLIAHVAQKVYDHVGYTTTDGIYINEHLIEEGDCTGPKSAEQILKDPSVNIAILECARGGLLRAGLAFDQCDVGIVTNVAEDHLGLKDIHTIEDMARVKAVVAETVKPGGFAILNADNKHTYEMASRVKCNVALFSMNIDNTRLMNHCLNGGVGISVEDGYLTVIKGMEKIRLCEITDIPLSYQGKASFMIENILAATVACYVSNIPKEIIVEALLDFIPSPERTPGRLNIFRFEKFQVLIDYAHNPHGLQALGKFIHETHNGYKVGILTGVGDRRREDIIQFGRLSSTLFDEVIIRLDEDSRGRPKAEIVNLLSEGIKHINPAKPVHIIANELEALNFAIKSAREGAMIIHLCENIKKSIDVMQDFLEVDNMYGVENRVLVKA